MFALYDDQRQNLIRLGIMLAVGAAAVLPFTISPTSLAASAETMPAAPIAGVPAVPGRIQFPTIAISRDPFVPDRAVLTNDASASDLKVSGDPNASTSLLPVVRAVVTGDDARALVDNAGVVQVLGVGDRLGSEVITAIDATGVMLSSGIRLVLAAPR